MTKLSKEQELTWEKLSTIPEPEPSNWWADLEAGVPAGELVVFTSARRMGKTQLTNNYVRWVTDGQKEIK